MLNRVILMGRLTADPELKRTSSDLSVVSFTLAVERNYGNGKDKQTDFINCVAWRQTAEFISKYFSKGQLMTVEGSIQVRNYTDKNGNKRQAVEVLVGHTYFAGSKPETQGGAYVPPEPFPTKDVVPDQTKLEQTYPPLTYSSGNVDDFTEIGEADLPF